MQYETGINKEELESFKKHCINWQGVLDWQNKEQQAWDNPWLCSQLVSLKEAALSLSLQRLRQELLFHASLLPPTHHILRLNLPISQQRQEKI